jgi:hypothetical protein
MFPSSFQKVLIKFSKDSPSSHWVPQIVPNSTTISPHMFCPKLSSFHLHRWAKGQALYKEAHKTRTLVFRCLQSFSIFLVMGQSKWLITKKSLLNLGWTPHFFNTKMNKDMQGMSFLTFQPTWLQPEHILLVNFDLYLHKCVSLFWIDLVGFIGEIVGEILHWWQLIYLSNCFLWLDPFVQRLTTD